MWLGHHTGGSVSKPLLRPLRAGESGRIRASVTPLCDSHEPVHNHRECFKSKEAPGASTETPKADSQAASAQSQSSWRRALRHGAGPDKARQGPGENGRRSFYIWSFYSTPRRLLWGHKTTRKGSGESSPLQGRQEIPKMLSPFLSTLPKQRLYFLFQCL